MAASIRSTSIQSQTDGTLTIAKPAGLAVGDILIAHLYAQNTGYTTPSGWTALSSAGAGPVEAVLWKRADAADVAATDFTFVNAGTKKKGALLAIQGPKLTDPMFVSNQNGATATSITISGITPAAANSLLLFLSTVDGSTTVSAQAIATSNPSWAESYNVAEDHRLTCVYANRPEATATGNATATLGASKPYGAHIVSIAPGENVSISVDVFNLSLFLFQFLIPPPVFNLSVSLLSVVMGKWRAAGKSTTAWTARDKTE